MAESLTNRQPENPAAGKTENCDTATVLSEWVTRAELAAQLGVSVSTLAKWSALRIGPVYIRVGIRSFYRVATVRAWLIDLENRRLGGTKR